MNDSVSIKLKWDETDSGSYIDYIGTLFSLDISAFEFVVTPTSSLEDVGNYLILLTLEDDNSCGDTIGN